jgi:hypothetical protein
MAAVTAAKILLLAVQAAAVVAVASVAAVVVLVPTALLSLAQVAVAVSRLWVQVLRCPTRNPEPTQTLVATRA